MATDSAARKPERFLVMLFVLGGLVEAVIFALALGAKWLADDLAWPFAVLALFFLFCPTRWWPL